MGDMYWNVKMEGWSNKSAFTDGLSKLIEDLALVPSLLCCLQVEVVVLDDSICGDEGFDLLIALKTNESHVDEGVAGDSVGDFQLPNFESIFNVYNYVLIYIIKL
ncbi:hypothetical protein Hanom_Chr17g01582441 [Helianthus anomalus]